MVTSARRVTRWRACGSACTTNVAALPGASGDPQDPSDDVRVGFTGTQTGLADSQVAALARVLVELGVSVLRHGSCIGGDAWAHYLARVIGARVELHPPVDRSRAADVDMFPGERVHRLRPYLVRNRHIVDACYVLVACPREEHGETDRSGTWSTVRYTRRVGRPVIVVRPSGRIERECCE